VLVTFSYFVMHSGPRRYGLLNMAV
jgi:hypothetical protein